MKKNIFKWVIFFILYYFAKGVLFAQTFSEISSYELNPNGIPTDETFFGCGISTYDFNEDGWDDLTITSYGYPARLYKNINGTLILETELPCANNSKACIWGDVDEDGDNDLFIAGSLGASKLYIQEDDNFIDASEQFLSGFPEQKAFTGASFQDVNLDGYLDLLVYNWSPTEGNEIWLNENGQQFTPLFVPGFSDIGKYSFQGSFTDLNDNITPDLFVSNDHFQGNDLIHFEPSNDALNYFFSNELLMPGNSMSASWGDFDNDLDEDLYISNGGNTKDHLMIQQIDQNFTTQSMAVNFTDSWSASWIDFENDGWLDLFVSTLFPQLTGMPEINSANKFYKNNNGTLELMTLGETYNFTTSSYTNSTPDINHDGKKDILITEQLSSEIRALINNCPNNFHTLQFNLKGRWSNRNAIGTRYNVFTSSNHFEGYLRSGENFMTQNSQNIIIGIGNSESIDSLKIFWPSGLVETYFDLIIDQQQSIVEGDATEFIFVNSIHCNEDMIELSAQGLASVYWSNGNYTLSTTYHSDEVVLLETWLSFGHSALLNFELPDIPVPIFDYIVTPPTCADSNDGSIYYSYLYNPLQEIHTNYISQLSEGETSFTFEFDQGCNHTEMINLVPQSHFTLDSLIVTSSCPELSNGQAIAYTSNGFFNNNIDNNIFYFYNLAPGEFSNELEDEVGCPINIDTIIPSFEETYITVSSPSCIESTNGSIQLTFPSDVDSNFNEVHLIPNVGCGSNSGIVSYANGCSYAYDLFIEPQESFSIDLNLPSQLCPSDSILFSPFLASSSKIIWEGNITPNEWITTPGVLHISFSNEIGCSFDTIWTITQVIAPTIGIDWDNELISIEIDSQSPDSYQCIWPDGSVGWTHSIINNVQIDITILSLDFGCHWDTTFNTTSIDDFIPKTQWQCTLGHLAYLGENQDYCIIYNSLGQEIQRLSPLNSGQEIDLPMGQLFIIRTPNQTVKIPSR